MHTLKKLFDWTPRDLAYWEKIQRGGLGNFILRYGIAATGGLLFVVLGLVALIGWIRQVAGQSISSDKVLFLVGQLVFIALVSMLAGVINSLIIWLLEQKLYRRYKALQKEQ